MARGNQDIVKKNSKLESFLHRSLTADTFHRIRGYESCICVSEKENKAFKYVVLGDEWIYLTENPPKSIKGVVHLRDVLKVELINDYPTFLSGEEKRNTQHIAITYTTSEPARRRSLRRSRHRSPRDSLVDLRDRSNNSTPVGYASSVDGSEDVPYFSHSTTSLPRSRPTSRGSVGSQRESRPNMSKKKKKAVPLNESWEQDSILRSLKEEIEEDMLEDIEEDSLSVKQSGNKQRNLNTSTNKSERSLPRLGSDSLDTSQTSVRRLPPHPKKGAFETVVTPPLEVKTDAAGVEQSPVVEVADTKSGCSCMPFFGRGSKSQVAPISKTNGSTEESLDFSSSKTKLIGDGKNGIPTVAISTMSDDGRESHNSRQSSILGLTGPGSRSATPSQDTDRMGSFLPSQLNGSINGLNSLSVEPTGSEQRETVLHIYLLDSCSPMIMLIRGAWNNYLIRATLSLEPVDESLEARSVTLSSKHQREKCELLYNQLKQQLLEPSNSMEDYFLLFTDLKRATQKNFLMKKLFWRSGDMFNLMVQQLQKYMPRTKANLHTEEGRAQRVDELEFVILLVTTLSLMFRESEILAVRMHALKAERGKYVIDLLMTLTSPLNVPEKQILLMKHWSAPSKNTRFGSTSTLNRDGELYQLLSEYIQVSITAIFEIFLMAKQNWFTEGEGIQFTVNWMVKVIEESTYIDQFVERMMSQVLEVINLARFGAVSSDQAIYLFYQFTLLQAILDHSSPVLMFLRNHYYEEFKYFIQGPALARKLPAHFPITPATVSIVSVVSGKVLGQSKSRESRPL